MGEGRSVATGSICGVGSLGFPDPFDFSFFPGFEDEAATLGADAFFGAADFLGGFPNGKSVGLAANDWVTEPSEWEAEEKAGSSIEDGVEADNAEFQRSNFNLCCRAFTEALVNAWQCSQF